MESKRMETKKRTGRNMEKLCKKLRIMHVLLLFILSLLLEGCSLARADLQEMRQTQERLCGVLVTVGDQRARVESEIDLEGRTFSSLAELERAMAFSSVVEGMPTEDGSYVFGEIKGHFFGIFEEEDADGTYTHFINDGSFADIKASTKVSDTGTEQEMEAVVLAQPGLREPIYMDPVYQRDDGTVYVSLSGGGFLVGGIYEEGSVTGGVHDEGEVYKRTFTSRETESVNGEEEVYSVELAVSCEMRRPVQAVRILEMSGENQLLGTQPVSREMEQVTLHGETAYVIVEEEHADGTVRRSLYDWDQKAEEENALIHKIYYPGEDGLLCPVELRLVRAES